MKSFNIYVKINNKLVIYYKLNGYYLRSLMKNGFIIINKEAGISSHSVVSRVKRLFGASKAGHTGTLDPMATGVLPVLIERAVKASEYMLTDDKHYLATLLLGRETDTEDITGNVISKSDNIPHEAEVRQAVATFIGASLQTPPMFSALKHGGKKLYELARRGEVVEREPREITVYDIKTERLSEREYSLDVKCSKGTYIRTLCADIGKKLGCGACMSALARLEAGGFQITESITLGELEAMSADERMALLRPTEEIFAKYEKIYLQNFFSKLAHSGLEIYLSKIGVNLELGTRVSLYDEKGFFAIGEVRDFDGGAAIKPIKQFEI